MDGGCLQGVGRNWNTVNSDQVSMKGSIPGEKGTKLWTSSLAPSICEALRTCVQQFWCLDEGFVFLVNPCENMEGVKTYCENVQRMIFSLAMIEWWWLRRGRANPPSLIQLSETFEQVNLINFLIRQALKTLEKGSSLIYLSVVHTIPLYGGSSTESNLWINLQSLENAFRKVNFG